MGIKAKVILAVSVVAVIIGGLVWWLSGVNIPVLQPHGEIGLKERNLILFALALSLIVVIPTYYMLISFSWKYREGNKAARYDPGFDHSRLLEAVWWGVPLILISILATVTWRSSHDLDPFRALSSTNKQLSIQVVALQWRWLFIYPRQGVASVNFVQLPAHTAVNFQITADAPMNSFWLPQLGGQIYAMSGMSTHLHLIADKPGDYYGSSANISGYGFSGMKFTARASSENDFNRWVQQAKKSHQQLTQDNYDRLAQPNQDGRIVYFSSVESGLYNHTVMKFEGPGAYSHIMEDL